MSAHKMPKTDGEKMRLLADWHDKRDDEAFFPVPQSDREVQRDLRRIADRLDALDDVTFGYRKGYAAAMAEAERDIEALRVEVDAWRATAHAAADQRDTWHRRAMDALKLLDEVAPALATGGGEPEAPPEPDPWPRRIWLKVDLHDAPLGPYEVDEWQHYTLNGEDHHHPVIVGQDGRIHLPAALWEPITEPAPEATTPGAER